MFGTTAIKRPLAILTLTASIFAFGASIVQYNSNSYSLNSNSINTKRLDDVYRNLASTKPEKINGGLLSNAEIDGEWNVMRITDVNGVDVFDKENKDVNKFIRVSLELIQDGLIKVDNDLGQLFFISKVSSDKKELVLFKSFDQGHEYMVVKKFETKKQATKTTKTAETQEEAVTDAVDDNRIKGLRLDKDVDLYLASAINPELSQKVLNSVHATGGVSIYGRNIVDLNVNLDFGENRRNLSMPSVEIKDGGVFNSEDEVSGIISNDGEFAYNIRIATGELKGTMLKFVTEEEYDRIKVQEEEAKRFEEETKQRAAEISSQKVNEEEVNQPQNDSNYDQAQGQISVPSYDDSLENESAVEEASERVTDEGYQF